MIIVHLHGKTKERFIFRKKRKKVGGFGGNYHLFLSV